MGGVPPWKPVLWALHMDPPSFEWVRECPPWDPEEREAISPSGTFKNGFGEAGEDIWWWWCGV